MKAAIGLMVEGQFGLNWDALDARARHGRARRIPVRVPLGPLHQSGGTRSRLARVVHVA